MTDISVTAEKTLFEKVGGDAAIEALVERLYAKILSDQMINYLFKNTDMGRQKGMMRQFLHALTGGPVGYNGKQMRDAHSGLGITEDQFLCVAGHVKTSLEELEVAGELQDLIMGAVAGFKDDIVVAEAG